jgi:hypothetical protein
MGPVSRREFGPMPCVPRTALSRIPRVRAARAGGCAPRRSWSEWVLTTGTWRGSGAGCPARGGSRSMRDAPFGAFPVGPGVSGMWGMRERPRLRVRAPIGASCMSGSRERPRGITAPESGSSRISRDDRGRAGFRSEGNSAPRPLARRDGTPPDSLNGIRLIPHFEGRSRSRRIPQRGAQAKGLNSLRTPRDARSREAVQPGVAVLSSSVKLSAGRLLRRQYPKWALARFFYV